MEISPTRQFSESTAWTPGEYAESLFEVEATIPREQERKKKANADLMSKLQDEMQYQSEILRLERIEQMQAQQVLW